MAEENTALTEPTVVTKFTEYDILNPNWFTNYLQEEIATRDLNGLTKGRVNGITISEEHPLVKLTGAVLTSGNLQQNTAGLLPSIAVVPGDANEENTRKGYGHNAAFVLDQAWIDNFRQEYPSSDMRKRINEGIITDQQLSAIENAIIANESAPGAGDGTVLVKSNGFWEREKVMISLWTETLPDRTVLSPLLRAVIYDMTFALLKRKIKDIQHRTARGLVNMNFGRVLYGEEHIIEFTNSFRNFVVTSEPCLQNVLDKNTPISSIDAFAGTTEVNENFVDSNGKFSARSAAPGEGYATVEGDIENE